MRTVVVVQARMGSTRLPGKVAMDVGGRPMVAHVIDRAARLEGVEEVAVAIPDLPEDDSLAALVGSLDVRVIRGPSDDVLARYAKAAETTRADAVVRVTADCPLLSPMVSSAVIGTFAQLLPDYCSNTLVRTWPRGLDTEVFTASALQTAAAEATDMSDREHVTPFLWRQPRRFRLESVTTDVHLSHLRLTVDTPADLDLVRRIHSELGPGEFDLPDIVDLMSRSPDLARINAGVPQKSVS